MFLITGVARDADRLGGHVWMLRPGRLLAATAGEVALLMWGVFLWSQILARFDGPQPAYRTLLRVWCSSTLAKYIPGSMWSVAATAEMATRVGASPVALPSSFLLQSALNFVGALTLAALLNRGDATAVMIVPMWLVAIAVVGALALVHPAVLNAIVRRAARAARHPPPEWRGSWAAGAFLLALYVATWAGYGATFGLFLSGVTPVEHATWAALAGVNALAFAAGFVAFFAPGGVGVREAALVGLLAPFVPGISARVAIAAASRLWLVATELATGALALAAKRAARGQLPPWRLTSPEPRRSSRPATQDGPQGEGPNTLVRNVPVELLTDTTAALVEMTTACRAATHSIWIAQLAFDADCAAPGAVGETSSLLRAILCAANRSPDGLAPVDVRIVLNGGLLLDTSPALRRAIMARHTGANVRVRTVKAFPQVMHAKALIVDQRVAFVMGSSFVNGYWDCARHVAAGDPRASAGAGDRPFHDVAVRVEGAAAPALARWFTQLWQDARPAAPDALTDPTDDTVRVTTDKVIGASHENATTVRILRTTPMHTTARGVGHTEILDAYVDAIARATEYIYLESQYFSARPVAQAVRAALDAHSDLELILVLNQNPDVTAYRGWQNARLAEHDLLEHPRVGAFALWSTAPSRRAPDRAELTQVFVHSKVAVIDDAWATLGTANLDGASLHSYGDDFDTWAGRRVFRRHRNYDVNVELLDAIDGETHPGLAGALRRRLWSAHLGLPDECLRARPLDGWLPLWRGSAANHVARLARAEHSGPRGRVLPYVARAHPRAQLRALGIDLNAARLDLRFDPGRLEVLFNAGWMKKMLPERVRAVVGLT
jgi:phosphatidylserine/phosphatidylglycerophosphate/cardiolipin synthase-like enzyme/uncharacterized membrane protein YbhN (UPF0104 family)